VESSSKNARTVRQEYVTPSIVIAFQAYDIVGKYSWIYQQTLYAILNLCAVHNWITLPKGLSIVVYTDNPAQFSHGRQIIEIRKIERTRIVEGMGPYRFVHRLKLAILLLAAEPRPDSLFYCDGDIFFKSRILEKLNELNPKQSLMHQREDSLGVLCQKDRRMNQAVRTLRNQGFAIEDNAFMYNAGVIGLHAADFKLINRALEFTDAACCLGERHIWEQMGVSLALGQNTCVHTTDDLIHHYWDQREAYTAEINNFFESARGKGLSWPDWVDYAQRNPVVVSDYQQPTLIKRILAKAAGRSRMISIRMQDDIRKVQE
jgi:hypothetical protein